MDYDFDFDDARDLSMDDLGNIRDGVDTAAGLLTAIAALLTGIVSLVGLFSKKD